MRAKPPLSGNTIRQEDFNEKANNDRRFAEDFSAAYQADYYRNIIGRTVSVPLCYVFGDADVFYQRTDPGTERQHV